MGVGSLFFIILFIILYYFEHTPVTSLSDIGEIQSESAIGLNTYELSVFFCIFVLLQFWNMFNARAFETTRSALDLKGCRGFILIACIILLGQIAIVSMGGQFFNVIPLGLPEWLVMITITSPVLWAGEAIRMINRLAIR